MEAVSRGAHQAGGSVTGVTLDLFSPRLDPNPWLTEEERVSDFFPRLQRLTAADGFVVLRGGIGTLTEATLVWTLLQTGQISLKPFIFVGAGWRRLFDAFRHETMMTEADFALARVVDTVDEAAHLLRGMLPPTP
jgi:predicted Rossmann-fold nucleotide-binding protein